jgi:hypothetical protein
MGNNSFVIRSERYLGGLPQFLGFAQEGFEEKLIKIKIVSIDNYFASEDFRRKRSNALKRVAFHFLLTIRTEHISLKEPKGLIHNAQVSRSLIEWWNERFFANDDFFHLLAFSNNKL